MATNLRIKYNDEQDKLLLTVPNIGGIKGTLSQSGKSYIIASTDRFEAIPGMEGYTVQVMVLKTARKPKRQEEDDEPVERKKKRRREA